MLFMLTGNDLGLYVEIEHCTLGQYVNLITVHFCVNLNFPVSQGLNSDNKIKGAPLSLPT